MKFALFGGSFDPVHHGHLLLARDALETLGLDEVIFIPAAQSPHKLGSEPAHAEARLAMLSAALAGESRFRIDDSELHREGPSFTIDTVEQWRARAPGAEIFYLIGHDNLSKLHTWLRYGELRSLVQFVVFGRNGPGAAEPSPFPVLDRLIDISATEIRRRVAQGRSIRYLVPDASLAIIEARGLYRGTHPSTP